MPLKVTYFINQYPKTSHSFIRREILALERLGFEVQRVALRGWDADLQDQEDRLEQRRTRYILSGGLWKLVSPTICVLLRSPVRFAQAFSLATRMASQVKSRGLAHHWICVAEACLLLSWVKSFGARHVHAHFGTNSAEVVMVMRVLGGPPYSFTVHGPEEFLESMALPEKTAHSAFVVAISSFGRSQLCLRLHHCEWDKIHVVHCGIERSFYDVPQAPVADTSRFVCVGRLCEAKGQILLVNAVAKLIKKGSSIDLVLAGDGPLRAELEELIDKLAIREHVRITGWVDGDRVRDEILGARALVLPSFAEGLPVVIMEAMALRRPVISTYVAGIPELVVPGKTGWLVPAGSLDDLVTAIEACMAVSPPTLQQLGDEGYRRVIERHSIDTEVAKLASLIAPSELVPRGVG
jgi:colanic acid/amylovoran biosynthesis glycosyltransferase